MKKLLLAIVGIIAISCGNKEDNSCTCVQEKWEISVVKDIATQNIVLHPPGRYQDQRLQVQTVILMGLLPHLAPGMLSLLVMGSM